MAGTYLCWSNFFFLSMGNGDTNADEDDVMGRFVIVTTKLLVT